MEISFTRLRVYLECPWQYRLRFVLGERVPQTPSAFLGSVVHRALERYLRRGGGGLDALERAYEECWARGPFRDPEEERRVFARGRRILERFQEAERQSRSRVKAVEREFAYPLGRHTVRGMIDRLDRHPDGTLELIDYKSQMEPASEEEVADDLQLRFYALGARESLALEPSRLTLYYLASGRRVSVPYDASREAELKRLIAGVADRIEAGDFKVDTSFCPRCPFRRSCVFSTAR